MSHPASSGRKFTSKIHNDIYPSINPTQTDLSQAGKVVLITGAGRGIGRSISLRYAEAGVSTIILTSRTQSQLDEVQTAIKAINSSITVHTYTLDVADSPSVRNFATHLTEKLKISRLDILVNNAARANEWHSISEYDEDDYWKTVEVNIKGPYLMLKNFLNLMVQTSKDHGVVTNAINITSIGAVVVTPTASGYCISKTAVQRLCEFVDVEYGDKGVNCVGVHPGGVDTELTKVGPPSLQAGKCTILSLTVQFPVS